MNSTYAPLTVHNYPRRTNLYVNFAQTVDHDHAPRLLQRLEEIFSIETVLAIHVRTALHSEFSHYEKPFGPESRPTNV